MAAISDPATVVGFIMVIALLRSDDLGVSAWWLAAAFTPISLIEAVGGCRCAGGHRFRWGCWPGVCQGTVSAGCRRRSVIGESGIGRSRAALIPTIGIRVAR